MTNLLLRLFVPNASQHTPAVHGAIGKLAGIVERGKDFGGVPGEQETILALAAMYV